MAVYTELGAEALARIVAGYDIGALTVAKGIAEGVSNTNWLIETTGRDGHGARFILTMYERRIDTAELPFFLALLDHLADRGSPVPRAVRDREGRAFRWHEGPDGRKALALIEFLPGVSVSAPSPAQARAVGAALGAMHRAVADFPDTRANGLGPAAWRALAEACGRDGLDRIAPGLGERVARELDLLARDWPRALPVSVIHADLFPDNVLMLGERVSGMIDVYFACTDITAYDVAVAHAAWCFDADGRGFDRALSRALLGGYARARALSSEERAALPLLARGAAMRFLMTRAYDWMHTPADALVTRKDPLAFARRLDFYADPANAAVFAA